MDTIDKINYFLVKQNKTGADLSRALGLSNSVYSQWNTKKTKPRKSKLRAIAEYLGVTIEDLLPDDLQKGKENPYIQEDIGPNKQNVLNLIDDLSEAEAALLLERIKKIKESRV